MNEAGKRRFRLLGSGLVLVLVAAGSGGADQQILGKRILLKDPKHVGNPSGVDPTKRKVLVIAREVGSSATIFGDPMADGATLQIIANGATPSQQVVAIPSGSDWRVINGGYKWTNLGTANIPVKIVIFKSSGDTFLLKILLDGNLSGPGVSVLPPAGGTEDGLIFTVGGGGDTYCVSYGGPAGGKVIDASNPLFRKLHKIVGTAHAPMRKTDCPEVSPCNVEMIWGVYGDATGEFNNPGGVAPDSSGNVVYVADTGNHRIQRFTEDGVFELAWGTLCNLDDGTGCVDPDGPGPLELGDGQFQRPTGVAVAPSGSVYVADWGNDRIQKFNGTGTFIRTWGTKGNANGQFQRPSGVAVGPSGSVYVADERNDRIQRFTEDGDFELAWGGEGTAEGQFRDPLGVAVDSSGRVYVADERNDRIQRFTEDGDFELAWGTSCDLIEGTGCVDPDYWGPLDFGDGQFNGPTAVAVDVNDDVYVVDQGNERIQKFANDGMFLGWWGTKGPAPGQFIKPSGIAVDATGDAYYVSDMRDRIQKFRSCPSPSGAFLDATAGALD